MPPSRADLRVPCCRGAGRCENILCVVHLPPARRPSASKRVIRLVVRAYLRLWHDFEIRGLELAPSRGPILAVSNHASLLDVPAMMVTDPYPDSVLVVKASLFKVPLVSQALRAWGAIPVERQGRDLAGIRAILGALRAGRPVAIAAEGRRSRSGGHLEPVNPVLARIAVSAGVPIVPVGIAGSYQALPPGARFPRRHKVVLRIGEPFRLTRGVPDEEAAREIRRRIAALLPPDQQPLDAEAPAPA